MIALAVILFGLLLLERRRIGKGTESSVNPDSVTFKDCYDLYASETGRESVAFTTICTSSGRV
jgi:hypothetical protein